MGSQRIHDDAYFEVEHFLDMRIVKVTRRPRPFESEDAVNEACEPVQTVLDKVGRRTHRLLFDSRDAIGKNDPAYERWFAAHRRRFVLGFERVAILVKTPIGKLHADRLVAEDRQTMLRVFLDEESAVRYLVGE